MFCTNCGKEVADGTYICPHCGESLGQAPTQSAQQPATPAPAAKKSLTALISMIFAIVAISLFFIVQILSWTHAVYVFGVYILSTILGFVEVGFMWSSFTMSLINVKRLKQISNKNQALAALIISSVTVLLYFIFFIIGIAAIGAGL